MNEITNEIIKKFASLEGRENVNLKISCGDCGVSKKGYTLCACMISGSGKSYHLKTGILEDYHEDVSFDGKTLKIKPKSPGSFIGRNGRNIKNMQDIYSLIGVKVEMIK